MRMRVVHVRDGIDGAIYIGRPSGRARLKGSPFANPFKPGPDLDRPGMLRAYRDYLLDKPELWAKLPELHGHPLACWCRHDGEAATPETACHGDILVELLAHFSDDELRELAAMSTAERRASVKAAGLA